MLMEKKCVFNQECNGNGILEDEYGRSAYPLYEMKDGTCCKKCYSRVVEARDKTLEELSGEKVRSCLYCGGNAFSIICSTNESKYGNFCCMMCAFNNSCQYAEK